jgi:hypothetical protein
MEGNNTTWLAGIAPKARLMLCVRPAKLQASLNKGGENGNTDDYC